MFNANDVENCFNVFKPYGQCNS